MHELWVMAAVELHINATYYVQYPALKSVYGKDKSVLLCLVSYFPPMSSRTVLRTGSSRDSKRVNWIASVHLYWTIREKKETGGWGYGISRVIEEIASGFFGRLIKSNVEFPWVIKKKSCGIPRGSLVLGLKIYVGCS